MWTEKQLKQLEQGGNQKLRAFFERYNLQSVENIKIRYQTKAADYYRRRNLALATGNPFNEPEPGFDEGRTLLNGSRLGEDNILIEEEQPIEFGTSQLIEEERKEEQAADPVDNPMLVT